MKKGHDMERIRTTIRFCIAISILTGFSGIASSEAPSDGLAQQLALLPKAPPVESGLSDWMDQAKEGSSIDFKKQWRAEMQATLNGLADLDSTFAANTHLGSDLAQEVKQTIANILARQEDTTTPARNIESLAAN